MNAAVSVSSRGKNRREGVLALQPPPIDGVWRANEHPAHLQPAMPTGHALLDAQLLGRGWPLGALIECLLSGYGTLSEAAIWPLLLPAVVAQQQHRKGVLSLVNPPHEPFGPALAAAGVVLADLLWLKASTPASGLWLTEQALACADVSVVLAWLPQARSSELRRLHLAAARRPDVLLFALRPQTVAGHASPAPLRLRLDGAGASMAVHVFKCRGMAPAAPLMLSTQTPACCDLWSVMATASCPSLRPDTEKTHHDSTLDRLAVAA